MPITPTVRKLSVGELFSDTFPPRETPAAAKKAIDARTAGLRVLRKYLSELTFYRPMGVSEPPEAFSIPEKDIFIDWPDYERDLVYPSIAFIPGSSADYASYGMTCYVDESTVHKFGRNTALQWQAEYIETISFEVWSSKNSERRAIAAGLEVAMIPEQQRSGLYFRVPEYYNLPARFILMNRTNIEDGMDAINRRRLRFDVEFSIPIVLLINVNDLSPVIKSSVDVDEDTNIALDI